MHPLHIVIPAIGNVKSGNVSSNFAEKNIMYRQYICFSLTEEIKRLREEYLAASEIRKKFLEKRFGKHVIQREVENYFSSEWLKDNSKKCPNCGTHIQVSIFIHSATDLKICNISDAGRCGR